ncbi:hypothetical protein BEN47_06355 [Hymenobacter lapidarius]|uniref:Lipocalin-like domain-containing protein n=1 Tax=Hymenobacter lapidarius TaxID=1908237 RepID=A0A1G1SQH9_9BACT|nr:hypothetical protein [Hymenobacter lapidarius]OGX80872.1 hypothetical protein BEN47_06355 [Hymenobacter lapidarius]
MRHLFRLFLLPFIISAGLLAGCKKDSDPSGLAGAWKLTSRTDCYCPAGQVLNETLTLTNTRFSFTRDGQVVSEGSYKQGTGAKCGTTALLAVLALTEDGNQPTYKVPFILDGQTLVLDYRNRCISDSPLDTYERL